jgi:hypothetical protein
MDHVKAVSDHAAERYLLGEMSAGEAEEFESHYFACQECAADVEVSEVFITNARAAMADGEIEPVPKKDALPEPRESFWDAVTAWLAKPAFTLPAAASLVFGAISLYQGLVVIPGLQQVRILPAFQLAGVSRGEVSQITVPSGTSSVSLGMDIPPDAHFSGYVCELSVGGRAVSRLNAPAPAQGDAITLGVPTGKLQSVQNELRLYGADAAGHQLTLVSTFAFNFKFR